MPAADPTAGGREAAARASDWFGELTDRSIETQKKALRAFTELLDRLAPSPPASDRTKPGMSAPSAYFDLAREWAGVGATYYERLLDLGRDYQRRVFEQLYGRSGTGAGSPPATRRRVEMTLHAPRGEEATGSFVLENKEDHGADVSFLVSDVAPSDGGPAFRPELRIEPPRLHLGPGEERVVTLALSMDPDRFEAGRLYRGTVVVQGHDELELALAMWADVATPPTAD